MPGYSQPPTERCSPNTQQLPQVPASLALLLRAMGMGEQGATISCAASRPIPPQTVFCPAWSCSKLDHALGKLSFCCNGTGLEKLTAFVCGGWMVVLPPPQSLGAPLGYLCKNPSDFGLLWKCPSWRPLSPLPTSPFLTPLDICPCPSLQPGSAKPHGSCSPSTLFHRASPFP